MPGPGQEARAHARVPVAVEVRYRTAGSFLVSYSLNLSRGGLFLETDNLPPIGAKLAVNFTIPGAAEAVTAQAEVMWVRKESTAEGLPRGVGLKFDGLERDIGALIDQLASDFAGVRLVTVASEPFAQQRIKRYLQAIISCQIEPRDPSQVGTELGNRPDLLLVDLDSCGEAGLEALRQAAAHTPVVLAMALVRDRKLAEQAASAGAVAVLANPPPFKRLRDVVLELLARPAS